MRSHLDEVEQRALLWLYAQSSPVYGFKPRDPDISTIRKLIKKRLARVAKIIEHPRNKGLHVSCFTLTRKGKRYSHKLSDKIS